MLVSRLCGGQEKSNTDCVLGELHELGANLTLMIQADMLGYHAPGEPAQLGLPARCVLGR